MVEFAAGGPLLQDGQRHGARHPPFVARHPPVSCKEAPNPRPWSSAGIWQQLELWMRSGCLVLVKGNSDRSKASSQYFSGEEAESGDGWHIMVHLQAPSTSHANSPAIHTATLPDIEVPKLAGDKLDADGVPAVSAAAALHRGQHKRGPRAHQEADGPELAPVPVADVAPRK